jgi:hypothetical protein
MLREDKRFLYEIVSLYPYWGKKKNKFLEHVKEYPKTYSFLYKTPFSCWRIDNLKKDDTFYKVLVRDMLTCKIRFLTMPEQNSLVFPKTARSQEKLKAYMLLEDSVMMSTDKSEIWI